MCVFTGTKWRACGRLRRNLKSFFLRYYECIDTIINKHVFCSLKGAKLIWVNTELHRDITEKRQFLQF